MNERFLECLALVLESEGGYSNHKADKGGATNFGITQKVYDEWRVSKGFGRQPVSGISRKEVEQIYFSRYWKMGKCDQLPPPLDYVHFDGCVNHGIGQATKFLQRAVEVDDDGRLGPMTLEAIQDDCMAGALNILVESVIEQRKDFYTVLATRDGQSVFLKGWMNRMNKVEEHAQVC